MAQIHATVFFVDNLLGFSETHYLVGGTDLPSAQVEADKMIIKRSNLLGTGVKIPYLRLGDNLQKGSVLVEPNPATTANKDFTELMDTTSDFPWSTLLCRFSSGVIGHRSLYMSGCPDLMQVDGAGHITDTFWNKAGDAYKKYMTSGIWGYRALDRNQGTSPATAISGWTNSVNVPGAGSITAANHGIPTGAMVRVSGVKVLPGSPNINGVWQVIAVTNSSLQLKSGKP